MENSNIQIEDLDLDYYFAGIEDDLKKANLDINSRVFPEILIAALDKLVAQNKSSNSTKFNRILFSHILDFKSLGKAQEPILVSDFFNSYFQVYESMRRNRDVYGKSCIELSGKISDYKQEVIKSKQTEKVLENGQTNNSKVRLEIRDIAIYQDLTDVNLDNVFKGQKIIIEYESEKNEKNNQFVGQTPLGDSFVMKEIPLSQEGLNNSYQFAITDINKKITVSLQSKDAKKVLDHFYPGECFDSLITKTFEIPDIGKVELDIVYINSFVNYINKLITQHEVEYEENHVHFDNLESSILLLEFPFKNFLDKHNDDPERRTNSEVDPNKNSSADSKNAQNKQSYLSQVHRNEIEVSEKLENLILNVSGRQCIIWDTIYFLMNKIVLGCVTLVLAYRADYATLLLALLGLAFESNNISLNKFGKLVFFLTLSMLYDFVWLLGSLSDWTETTPLEGSSLNGIRKLATVIAFVVIILKIVLCFSGWRLSIIYKMKEINLLNLPEKQIRSGNVKAAVQQQKEKKRTRPVINYNRKQVTDTSLRFLDGGL